MSGVNSIGFVSAFRKPERNLRDSPVLRFSDLLGRDFQISYTKIFRSPTQRLSYLLQKDLHISYEETFISPTKRFSDLPRKDFQIFIPGLRNDSQSFLNSGSVSATTKWRGEGLRAALSLPNTRHDVGGREQRKHPAPSKHLSRFVTPSGQTDGTHVSVSPVQLDRSRLTMNRPH